MAKSAAGFNSGIGDHVVAEPIGVVSRSGNCIIDVISEVRTVYRVSGRIELHGHPAAAGLIRCHTGSCGGAVPRRRCGRVWAGGSIITITNGAIRPLTAEPRMRFTTVCPILSPRLPDAFLSFQKLSAHSLLYPSGCPADGVHLPSLLQGNQLARSPKIIALWVYPYDLVGEKILLTTWPCRDFDLK
jgi:hypothetical protein